jgi:membrane protein DedA with SNARE-associated domain
MDFTQFVALFGSWVVLAVVAIQCAGIPAPGGAVLIAAAVSAGVSQQVELAPIVVAAAAGAVLGSIVGFRLGSSRKGYGFLLRHSRVMRLDERKLKLARYLFLKHGGAVVVLGRFVSVSRTWSAFLAGLNKMGWPRFLLFSVLGGVVWAAIVGVGAYYLGDSFHQQEGQLGIALLALVLGLCLLSARFLRRRVRQLEEEAQRAYPEPLGMPGGESEHDNARP